MKCSFCGIEGHDLYAPNLKRQMMGCLEVAQSEAKAANKVVKKLKKELEDLKASIEAERWRTDEL